MATDDKYERARATRTSNNNIEVNTSGWSKSKTKRTAKKIFKSPLLIIIAVALIVGAVGGFFIYKGTSKFEMNPYYVNGTASAEQDYVLVDVTAHKESKVNQALLNGVDISMEEVYNTLGLVDGGVTIKFFGIDVSKTVKSRVLYREDISHDPIEVSKIDVTTAGVYYIEYTSTHFAFKNITLIRTVIITGVEVDG